MSKQRYLLDTSAVLALVENKDGAERVESLLREQTALVPWTVLMEVFYITRREAGRAQADQRYAIEIVISPFPYTRSSARIYG